MQMARLISVLSVVVDEQLHDLQTEDIQRLHRTYSRGENHMSGRKCAPNVQHIH